VVRFVAPENRQYEEMLFPNGRERFEWCRGEQRVRELTPREIRLLLGCMDQWFDHADMFAEQWPVGDRRWLGRIAPDHFPQYAEMETTGGQDT
jgi:hypothetical protein